MIREIIIDAMVKSISKINPLPKPFLGPIFKPEVEPVIATGYKYHKNEIALHGVGLHRAIDFDVERGVEIINPCDGWFVATYGEIALLNEDGTPRVLSAVTVRSQNPNGAILNPPSTTGEWPIYFGSYVVQGWHGNGRYTQYAHIDWANPRIPFYQPVEEENGDLKHNPILRATVETYRKPSKAVFLKAGEVIGTVGMSGCGWGKRCYGFAEFDRQHRPDFSNTNYTYYTNPHLHFMTFGRRVPYTRRPSIIWDPFNVYGEAGPDYPYNKSQWSQIPHSLWLTQN